MPSRLARFCGVAISKCAGRLIQKANAQKLDEGPQGTLYSLELDRDDPLVMAEVTCPSTGRKYMLRVWPWVRTVQEAIAWTFGLQAEDYQPVQEA